MSIEIPLKPKNDDEFTTLRKGEKEIVVYAVLCQTDNQTAFVRFHPEYAVSVGKTSPKYALSDLGKRECKNFWSYPKVRAYREAYEQTLAEFLGRGTTVVAYDDNEEIDGDALARKILSDLAALVKNGRIQDYEVLKTVTDILGKFGKLKGVEERIIPPVRVLMTRCSECRMRITVESMVLNGEMLDMCAYCKCRKIAEEHGYRFNDGKDLLEIPQEIIADLESKNDVKLLDILDGKIEN